MSQVRNINFSAENLSNQDSRSLKIWVKVVMECPVQELVANYECGFELVKVVLEKLWQDCITSYSRNLRHQITLKKLQQKKQEQVMQALASQNSF